MRVSVIVAARNEASHIGACLESLLEQSFSDFEVIVVDGMSDDGTVAVVNRFVRYDKRIRLLHNPNLFAAQARNIGFDAAKGELVGYVDAHTTARRDWLEVLVKTFEQHSSWHGHPVGAVGSIHKDTGRDPFSAVITAAFAHPLGGGGSSYRPGGRLRAVPTAYACLYSREALSAVKQSFGYYDPYFVKGQDADLNWRLNRVGFVVLQQPRAVTFYVKRTSWSAVWRQMVVAAFWRAKLTLRHPSLFRPAYFAPLCLYVAFLVLIVVGFFWSAAWLLFAALFVVYLLVLVASIVGRRFAFGVLCMLLLIHAAYALGLVKGLVCGDNRLRDRV